MSTASDDFQQFAERLTEADRRAIKWWLDIGSLFLRQYQMDGSLPSGVSQAEMDSMEEAFSGALAKAVVCRELVFRGLSASRLLPPELAYVQSFIHGPSEIIISTHDSATLSEDMGRSYCRLDEPKDLAVLLRIRTLTARYLRPLAHKAKDEKEVVLLKGTHYRRDAATRLSDPRPGLEFWEVNLIEDGLSS
jgi:hypothetical protein